MIIIPFFCIFYLSAMRSYFSCVVVSWDIASFSTLIRALTSSCIMHGPPSIDESLGSSYEYPYS